MDLVFGPDIVKKQVADELVPILFLYPLIGNTALEMKAQNDARILHSHTNVIVTCRIAEMYKGLRSGSGSLNENMVKQSIYEGVKSSGDLAQQIQQAMAGQLAAQTRAAQKGASNTSQTPSKRVELSFRGGSLEGSENAVEALLRQLEQAGLTA